ncbi:hypothetical protein HCN44_009825 [Aphidius gifuensis]|uniref:THAP-type domain-containing protein n=1 Tax=Aphidius gifuensis TaxID=684658 RepID=A0A834Y1C1_APHGI|nr:hypothetical protein HCN44_009825 [Aphidius gifuensis]
MMIIIMGEIRRLALWVKNVGDEDLLSLPPATLHKTRRICYLHFAEDDFTTDKINNLKSTAHPTIFDETVKQLSDESIKHLQNELVSKIKKSGNLKHKQYTNILALWVKNVGDEDLLSLPPATLHKTRRITLDR